MKAGVRPRRGAPRKGEVSARERILATASDLFYREGIRAIGIDTVVEQSGVSKTSLYRVFDSKDALICAFAAEKDQLFWAWWDGVEEQHAGDLRALLEALRSGIAEKIGRPAYRSSPLLNLTTAVTPAECRSGAARPCLRRTPARPRRSGSGWWFGA
jgi:AcrR family transcriptional regulator